MNKIKINTTGDCLWWLYGAEPIWKEYITPDFDNKVVLTGNQSMLQVKEAIWYKKALDILNDLDFYEVEEFKKNEYGLTQDQLDAIIALYENCTCIEEIVFETLKILYPNKKFSQGTIRGACQSDWQSFIIEGEIDRNLLVSYYFGQLAEINVEFDDEEKNFVDVITLDELWEAERKGLKDFFKSRYELRDDFDIYQADGYRQMLDYKKVS